MDALVLFDIDATLLATGGVGVSAMRDAGRELFGEHFTSDGLEYAGRLDPLLIRELLDLNRVARTQARELALREAYIRIMHQRMPGALSKRALPGVNDLLACLSDGRAGVLGVLTGNYAETGRLKLRSCGIDPDQFVIAAWGDDSPHEPPARDHLPPIALRRFRERFSRDVEPGRVTIIGDTPHDVRCAKANGCRSIGVATGKFSRDQLLGAGADHAVENLSATSEIVEWLTTV